MFIVQSAATMTGRAVALVAPDWQVQLVGTTDTTGAKEWVSTTVPVTAIKQVDYADVASLSANTGGTVQSAGTGKAVGLESSYAANFPRQIRLLAGSMDGVLLAQQTAANLHAGPGDTVTIERLGQPPIDVKIDGIVEMPSADQFFQIVSSGTQGVPNAPPDNVVLLPGALWNQHFASQLESMPQTAQRQLHVSFDHANLPGDPSAALVNATGLANNLAAKLAGEGVIANNLAARLDGVRKDSLFAKILFLFLGAPGAAVATLLTMLIVLSGSDRRRRDVALLQIRGASATRILFLSGIEAVLVGGLGAIGGIIPSALIASAILNGVSGSTQAWWSAAAGLYGLCAALIVFLLPTWLALRCTAMNNAAQIRSSHFSAPIWQRLGIDVILLVLAAIVFWQVSATGYEVVAAPEGVATASVDYKAYAAPALFWIGSALLLTRLFAMFMRRGRVALERLTTPIAGAFSKIVAASLSRESSRTTKGTVLVALAFSFAVSTAIFNTTYENQASIDAALTNGADVTISGNAATPASGKLDDLRKVTGVAWAEPMQHRFAYVGNDLQDLYGIDPASIGKATAMSNAYFANGDAAATLELLKRTPNGVLVSDETVSDFQLKQGDTINLRLQSGADHAYHAVSFTFIGIVREFPTAPSDSFLVANADHVAAQTKIPVAETILVKSAIPPSALAADIRAALSGAPGLAVSEIGDAAHRIGSSLVAVDLRSLTGLELAFALPIVAGAVGLVFALGLAERRRTFAILNALGAAPRHLGAFLWSEALIVYFAGAAAGLVIGWILAWVLIKLMTHVFDPPPDALYVSWAYIGLLCLTGLAAVVAAVLTQLRKRAESPAQAIRTF
jgi:putative ABC transport system permease protein